MTNKLDFFISLGVLVILGVLGGILYFWYLAWDECKCNPKNEARIKAKGNLGAIIRQQQYEHYQQGQFSDPDSFQKEYKHLFINNNYYEFATIKVNPLQMVAIATGQDDAPFKTQDSIGGVMFNVETKTFMSIICRTEKPFTPISYPFHPIDFTNSEIRCGRNLLEYK